MAGAEELVRDAYGFEVKKELLELYQQYEPILQREERERTERWNGFLTSFADSHDEQLGSRGSSARSLSALVEGLACVVDKDEKLLSQEDAQYHKQLQSLVQAGIPTEIRGQLWQVFLKVSDKRKPGLYPKLVKSGLEQVSKCRCKAPVGSYGGNNIPLPGIVNGEPDFVDTLINSPFETVSSGDLACYTNTSTSMFSHVLDNYDSLPSSAGSGPRNPLENGSKPGTAETDPSDQPIVRHCSICYSGTSPTQNGARLDLLDWVSQIDKDLHRTFPGHLLMDQKGKAALKNVLVAYSRYNPYVGYCQGMNFIAGVLLLFMDEEDAFWCLAAIVEDVLPGYFSLAMVAPQVDQAVFKDLVAHKFPSIASLFEELSVDVSSISMSWFLCIFVNSLPLESSLRVWDIMFFEGHPLILFRVSLALLEIYHKALLATEDGMECLELMAQIASVSFDGSRLIDVACIAYASVQFEQIQLMRNACRNEVFMNAKVPSLEGWSHELSLTGAQKEVDLVIGKDQAAQQLFGCAAPYISRIQTASNAEASTAEDGDLPNELDMPGPKVCPEEDPVSAPDFTTTGRQVQPLKIGRNEILGKLHGRLKASSDASSYLRELTSTSGESTETWSPIASAFAQEPSASALDRANRSHDSMFTPTKRELAEARPRQRSRGGTNEGLASIFSGSSPCPSHGDEAEGGVDADIGAHVGNHWRHPSRARVAAYEIASNPAIRQVAIAQSVLRLEQLAQNEDGSEASHDGAAEVENSVGSLRDLSSLSLRPGPRQSRQSRASSGFFLSMSALSASSANGQSAASVSASGASGTSGAADTSAILLSVLEGLKAEVKCAQERRRSAQERAGVLQQTSSLLTVKINRLLQELEEKKQTVEDLTRKVDCVKGELRELEDNLRAKESEISLVQMDTEHKQAALKEKDLLIANLQKKVKRFQRSSSHNVMTSKAKS